MMTGICFEYNGHKIEFDQRVFSEVLYIDGKLADKIKGFGKTHLHDSKLKGSIDNGDGTTSEVVVRVSNGPVTEAITLFCDGKEIETKHMA